MSAWAKPGVKCVCVDQSIPPGTILTCPIELTVPQKGIVYTISWAGLFTWPEGLTGIGVHLSDYIRAPAPDGIVYPLGIFRFRPLITKTQKQDVAKFRHLLTPSPIDAGLVPAGVELDA